MDSIFRRDPELNEYFILVIYVRAVKRQKNKEMNENIIKRLNSILIIASTILLNAFQSSAQQTNISKYGLPVITSASQYRESVLKDSMKKMIDLQSAIPNIDLDLRYAGTNNFMKRRMYPEGTTHTFMRLPAANALVKVQEELNALGFGLKVFDAYRPYSITEKFWELVHDDRYVADPGKGSNHNRGVAVDLTLIELQTKKELKMPTGFDNFTDSAHHDFMNLSDEVLKNRKFLREIMEKHGFVAFPTEWWHYSLPEPERFEALDIPFADLEK
jgi:D-alanyl-D-alanine dipeptidase